MVLLEFSVSPLGAGESVSPYVARAVELVAASGLDYRLHAMGHDRRRGARSGARPHEALH